MSIDMSAVFYEKTVCHYYSYIHNPYDLAKKKGLY